MAEAGIVGDDNIGTVNGDKFRKCHQITMEATFAVFFVMEKYLEKKWLPSASGTGSGIASVR